MTDDIEYRFHDFLDEVYPSVVIAGIEFLPSDILQSCDPIAYRCALADYESMMEEEYV